MEEDQERMHWKDNIGDLTDGIGKRGITLHVKRENITREIYTESNTSKDEEYDCLCYLRALYSEHSRTHANLNDCIWS